MMDRLRQRRLARTPIELRLNDGSALVVKNLGDRIEVRSSYRLRLTVQAAGVVEVEVLRDRP